MLGLEALETRNMSNSKIYQDIKNLINIHNVVVQKRRNSIRTIREIHELVCNAVPLSNFQRSNMSYDKVEQAFLGKSTDVGTFYGVLFNSAAEEGNATAEKVSGNTTKLYQLKSGITSNPVAQRLQIIRSNSGQFLTTLFSFPIDFSNRKNAGALERTLHYTLGLLAAAYDGGITCPGSKEHFLMSAELIKKLVAKDNKCNSLSGFVAQLHGLLVEKMNQDEFLTVNFLTPKATGKKLVETVVNLSNYISK